MNNKNYLSLVGASSLFLFSSCSSFVTNSQAINSESGAKKSAIQFPYLLPVAIIEISGSTRGAVKGADAKPAIHRVIKYSLDGKYKYKDTMVIPAKAKVKSVKAGYQIAVKQSIGGDHSKGYLYARYQPNWFSNDTLSIKTNDKGLLETVNSLSEDKSISVLSGLSSLFTGEGSSSRKKVPERGDFTIKRALSSESDLTELNGKLKSYGLRAEVNDVAPPTENSPKKKTTHRGLCIRPLCIFSLYNKKDGSLIYRSLIPSFRNYNVVSMPRTLGGKFDTKYVISNGMISGVDIEKNSEAMNVISLPINIAGQIASKVPKGILSYQENTAELEAQTKYISAQKALIEAQNSLEILQNPDTSTDDSSSE